MPRPGFMPPGFMPVPVSSPPERRETSCVLRPRFMHPQAVFDAPSSFWCDRAMGMEAIPSKLLQRYQFKEWNHAAAILAGDFPTQWADLLGCLKSFCLKKSAITIGGGGRSQIPQQLDGYLNARGWKEHQFDIGIRVDGNDIHVPTHKIDNFKDGVGIEV